MEDISNTCQVTCRIAFGETWTPQDLVDLVVELAAERGEETGNVFGDADVVKFEIKCANVGCREGHNRVGQRSHIRVLYCETVPCPTGGLCLCS